MIKTLTGRPVGRPREFDEEQVLVAAMEAFWRKGYEATSLVNLTDATGLNKASLYRVFGDKHQLFKSALQHYGQMEFQKVASVIRNDVSPLENLHAVVDKITSDFASDKGCMMINSLVELAPHDPEVKAILKDFGDMRVTALADMIGQARAAGEIRAELEPEQLAVSLMIALAGSAAMGKGFMSREPIVENLEKLIESWT
jgi:TetR/AcrR family transcriptional repressor of nem operon